VQVQDFIPKNPIDLTQTSLRQKSLDKTQPGQPPLSLDVMQPSQSSASSLDMIQKMSPGIPACNPPPYSTLPGPPLLKDKTPLGDGPNDEVPRKDSYVKAEADNSASSQSQQLNKDAVREAAILAMQELRRKYEDQEESSSSPRFASINYMSTRFGFN
jgi:hypothetical protein